MRRCFLVSYNGLSNTGGVEKVCHYLYEIFNEKSFNVKIVDLTLINNTFYGKLYKSIFGKIHIVAFTLFSSLYVAFNRKKNDIKIAHGFNSPFFKTDYLFVHGTMKGYAHDINQKITKGLQLLFWLEKQAVINSDVILSVSENALNEVKKYYTSKKIKSYIINNGVDEQVFYPIENRKESDKINIVFCGRLDYGKGVDDILNLAKSIEDNNIYHLIIACNNSNNTDLFEGLTNTTIHIGLTVNKMNEFYNSGDIMVFPSKYEGFEMVTLEALCAGIPVVGNDVGAVAELVRQNAPGVQLINKDNILHQINLMFNKYKSEKKQLHNYYASNYGLKIYKERLYKIIN